MKKSLIILFVFLYQTGFSQAFPAPSDFVYTYDYIEMNHQGYCEGEMVDGPYYCSHFEWEEPNFTEITASFDHYNIYMSDLEGNDITVLGTTTETNFEMGIGIIGNVWITAVYIDPDSESEPSNISSNESLPLSIDEQNIDNINYIVYNRESKKILILDHKKVINIKVIDLNGKISKSYYDFNTELDLSELEEGVYVIEYTTNNTIQRFKILI